MEYRTEEEQLEVLKRWWRENGRGTVTGIVLALALVFGWRAWQSNQQQALENASIAYQQLLTVLAQETADGGSDSARDLAIALREAHPGTTYAQFAGLHLARMAVLDGDLDAAEAQLRGVLADSDAGSELQQIATLRLARVLAAKGDGEQALAMLGGANTEFVASYAMVRGDILAAEGREAEALVAYEAAAAALDPGAPVPETLRQKLEYLGARIPGGGNGAG